MPRCPNCGLDSTLVHVHGHGQCARCHSNIEPCCSGAGDESDATARGGSTADLDALVRVLKVLGGSTTAECLANAFAARTGSTLQDATRILELARRNRLVQRRGGVISLQTPASGRQPPAP